MIIKKEIRRDKEKVDRKFGSNLRKLRREKGLTLEELADQINKKYGTTFNKSMISKWENGYEAQLSSVKYLSLFFDVTLNEILGFNEEILKEAEEENFKIPILGVISAGKPIFAEEQIIGYASKPPMSKLSADSLKDLFYLKVSGDSMDRIYPDGSYVLVRKNSYIQNGDNAVVLISDENEAVLKKIKIEDNYLTLIPVSYNEKHLPRTIDMNKKGIHMIGRVIGCYTDY